jgi:hypothetical protein
MVNKEPDAIRENTQHEATISTLLSACNAIYNGLSQWNADQPHSGLRNGMVALSPDSQLQSIFIEAP